MKIFAENEAFFVDMRNTWGFRYSTSPLSVPQSLKELSWGFFARHLVQEDAAANSNTYVGPYWYK